MFVRFGISPGLLQIRRLPHLGTTLPKFIAVCNRIINRNRAAKGARVAHTQGVNSPSVNTWPRELVTALGNYHSKMYS